MKFYVKKLNPYQQQIYNLLRFTKNGLEIYSHIHALALALRDYSVQFSMLDPYELADMKKGVDFLLSKLLINEQICIVADYDADGATSCAIMTKGLLNMGQSYQNIHYFLPDRQIHGYGLQPSVIDDLLKHYPQTKIIITVDNGISAVLGVEYAKNKGIEVLITDHHAEGDVRPQDAVCIINPNRKDCHFKSKALAGCGVAYYFIYCLNQEFKKMAKKIEDEPHLFSEKQIQIIKTASEFNIHVLEDYLVIGTIADVVMLDENNRFLVQKGLNRIRQGLASTGVKGLLELKKISDYKLNTEDIAFNIAPTLNAIGRLDDMTIGVKMLLTDNKNESIQLANIANQHNIERKTIEHNMLEIAEDTLAEAFKIENHFQFSHVLYLPKGHEGVVGIVASRIKEKQYSPTIVFVDIHETFEGEQLIKGSGRSISGLHIRDAIDYVTKKVPDCVVKFGGHAMAAGLTIKKSKLKDFQFYFDEYCKLIFNDKKPEMIYVVDEQLNLKDINISQIQLLNQDIWGQGFPKPLYHGLFEIVEQKLLKDNQHLKLQLKQNNIIYDAIWFKQNQLLNYDFGDFIYSLSINDFQNIKKIQLMIQASSSHAIQLDKY